MKKFLQLSICLAVLLALSGSRAPAKDHGDHGDDDHGRNEHDNGRHRGRKFDNDERKEARGWYDHHRDDDEFRDRDDWRPEYEERVRQGYVLDPEMRRMCRPVPDDLYRRLGPPPRRYRYVVIGPHVILVDSGYRVADVIHFEINLR